DVYIYNWLTGYSLLLGAVGGVLIADYIFLRRTHLDQAGLYKKDGPYWYSAGFNPMALIALAIGIGLCVPGFLVAVGVLPVQQNPNDDFGMVTVPAFLARLYSYAWFASFGASFVSYLLMMGIRNARMK
ncbi:MAG: cytosine permease, partial [Pirellulales bacterium]